MFSAPFHVDFDITLECTHKCKHCNVDAGNRLDDELSYEEICHVLDEFDDIGVCNISITGGEPLIRKDCIEILKYASRKESFKLTLNTNAVLLSKEVADEIKLINPNLLIAVSLDGYDAESYSILRKVDTNENNTPKNIFDRIIENILYAVEIGLNVSINYTITAATIGNFYKTFEFINGLGIKRMLGIKFFPFGQGEKYASELELDYEVWKAFLIDLFERKKQNDKYKGIKISVPCPWELYLPFYENQENLHEIETYFSYNSPLESQAYSKMRNIGCHAGITSCAVSANGDVYPCGTVSSKFPPCVCGNIRDKSFAEIWKGNNVFDIFREVEMKDIGGKCNECDLVKLCGGGCRSRAYFKYKDIKAPDYLCPRSL